jgi:hypothetical protein
MVRWFLLVVATGVATPLLAQNPPASSDPDSAFRRAQRMVEQGEGARGRALVDSLVQASREGTEERANALFWRATLAPDVPSAQRDYLRITVSYALTPRAADALLRLAQIDLTSGARANARRRLERLVLEHPTTPAATEGWFYLGVARRDGGDVAGGCAALDSARARLSPGDVERRNRVEFERQRCRTMPPGTPPPDSTKAPPVTTPAWSVQVAAFNTEREADALVRTVKERGYDARTAHIPPYYRVRIGFFSTRQEASALVTRLRSEGMEAIIVESEGRGF